MCVCASERACVSVCVCARRCATSTLFAATVALPCLIGNDNFQQAHSNTNSHPAAKVQVQTTPQVYDDDDELYAFKAMYFQYNSAAGSEEQVHITCFISTGNQKLLALAKSQTVMRAGRILGAVATPWVSSLLCASVYFLCAHLGTRSPFWSFLVVYVHANVGQGRESHHQAGYPFRPPSHSPHRLQRGRLLVSCSTT